jgi:hypothetical protein
MREAVYKAGDRVKALFPFDVQMCRPAGGAPYTHALRSAVIVLVVPCIYDYSVPMYLVTADNLECGWFLDDAKVDGEQFLRPDPDPKPGFLSNLKKSVDLQLFP